MARCRKISQRSLVLNFETTLACMPVHALLNIIPIQRNAVVAPGKIQHWLDLVDLRRRCGSVVALDLTEYDCMSKQGIIEIRVKLSAKDEKNTKIISLNPC